MKKLLSSILVVCMIISATACGNSSADNRETTVENETKNTFNPDVSEPNQSIANGALITETTTEQTKKNGSTYTINGVEFTISTPIEDYLYTLPDSNATYIDLDGFFATYGLKRTDDEHKVLYGHYYDKEGVGHIQFDFSSGHFVFSNEGYYLCNFMLLTYDFDTSKTLIPTTLWLSSDYNTDFENGVYTVKLCQDNGYKWWDVYCVSRETLVVIAYVYDCLNNGGWTEECYEHLQKAIQFRGLGEYVITYME